MEYFLQQLINGLTLGSIYGLIAIGYTMVFGIIGMVNFAHGDVFMVSAFIALIVFLFVTTWLGIGSVAIALAPHADRRHAPDRPVELGDRALAYRPLRGSFRLAPLISAIGMSIVLSNFVQVAQGPRNKPIPPLVQPASITLIQGSGNFAVTIASEADHHLGHHGGAARRLLVGRAEDAARPRAARLRAGSQAWRRCSASTSTARSR